MPLRRKYFILAVLSAIVVLLDQGTKWMVTARFRLGETLELLPDFFNLTYVRNTGAAFGILANADPAFRLPFFVIVPLIALLAIGSIFRKVPDDDIKLSVALSLVIGGAIGNLIDRARLSYVIDFIDFHWQFKYHFPAFNVADMAICIGVGILMLDLVAKDIAEGRRANASNPS